MTSLPKSLPIELWREVISFADRADIISATLVSRWLSCIAQPFLFSRIFIEIIYDIADLKDASFMQEDLLDKLEFLSTTDRMSKAVRHLDIVDYISLPPPDNEGDERSILTSLLLDKIFKMIPLFVNLRIFSGYGLLLTQEHIRNLRSLPCLVSLVLKKNSTEQTDGHQLQCPNDMSAPFCGALRKFELESSRSFHDAWWAGFLSPSATKTLELSTRTDPDDLIHILSLTQSPSMTALRSLTLNEVTSSVGEFIGTLTHCPSLRRLALTDYKQSVDALEHQISKNPDAAPVLEFATGPYCVVRALARYRHLRHISVTRSAGLISEMDSRLLFEALCEGSRSTLQRFTFTSESITTKLMTLFFTKFPRLRDGHICVSQDNLGSADNVLSFLSQSELPSTLKYLCVNDMPRRPRYQDLAQSHSLIVARLEETCPKLCSLTISTRTINVRWTVGNTRHSIRKPPDSELDSDSAETS
ncbi:hypothetical protein C8Q75DRAFT_803073 [Abortiporus biennis]|nr:hypothetical protein C8Q75DRAFT_803073 [Abortiporus biennis]